MIVFRLEDEPRLGIDALTDGERKRLLDWLRSSGALAKLPERLEQLLDDLEEATP